MAALIFASIFGNVAPAAAQAPRPGPCPTLTLADAINDKVSPVTNFISNLIFFEIPVRFAAPTAQGRITLQTPVLADGGLIAVRLGKQSVTLELDDDGAVCRDHRPVTMTGDDRQILATIAAALHDALPASGLETAIAPAGLMLSAPTAAKPNLEAYGAGLGASDFTDGSIGIPFIVIWLVAGATFFTFYMRFINLRGFVQAIRIARGTYDNPKDPGEVTHFQALTAAVSGTVGLGNIAGVAIAISIGGPGATLWMIVSGLFGMTSKFTECTLGLHHRRIDENGIVTGGPMRYLQLGLMERGWPRLGRGLSVLFCLLCIGGAFGAGNMFQVNQSSQQVLDVLVPMTGGEGSLLAGRPWVIGLVYAVFVGLVIVGGIKSITRVTEFLVPIMAAIYMVAAFIVIGSHFDALPAAFAAIFDGAFTPEGVTGGFIGVLIQGMRRASFSNEAGVGSAAIAHAAAKTKEPVAEGLVALLEPFIDTVVICTTTALVIVVTGMHVKAGAADGIALTSAAFATVIDWFPRILAIAVVLFAFSTSITWFYYGHRSFLFLVGDRPRADLAFKLAYLVVLIIGASMNLTAVMDFADAMLLAMAFPNMIGLYVMAPQVKRMLASYMARVKSGEIRPYAVQPAE
ncbi:MAG: alanine/glycine:cation symporter family protein [Pseudomonadota bacterium]